ncbi:MAG TPA: class I adenylate-forming enzyme family protein [Thermoleophilaceae bacterium]|jgi:fatty acid CoA ligase FadD22
MSKWHTATLADALPARKRKLPIFMDRPMELAPDVGCELDYGTLADLVVATSARLAAAGVRADDRVVVNKSNGLDVVILAFSAMRLGAVPALISPMVRPQEAEELLGILAPRLLATDRQTAAAGSLAGLELDRLAARACVVDGGDGERLPDPATPAPEPAAPRDEEAPVLITHSSGTTGTPKLCAQRRAAFESTIGINRRFARALRFRGTVAFNLSAVHLRTMAAMGAVMRVNLPLLFISGFDPQRSVEMLARHRPSIVEAHPASYVDWEPFIATHPEAFERGKFWFSNFDAVHPRTVKALLGASRRFVPVYASAYGQTESGPITTRFDTRLTAKHADGRCVGFPILGYSKVRIGGGERKRGEVGEIEVRSKGLVSDYLGRTELYEAKRDGDWWSMGDVGFRTRRGCLHVLDREVDAVEGVQSLLALEDTLMERIPAAREVVLIPADEGPPVPLVASYDGAEITADVWDASAADLEPTAPPLFLGYDEIPRTATGKVQRLRTRELLREGALR